MPIYIYIVFHDKDSYTTYMVTFLKTFINLVKLNLLQE